MRKILAISLHPIVLMSVGLAAAALVIWLIGPLISIAGFTPLESSNARWITILALVALVLLRVAFRAWSARRRNGQVVSQLIAQPVSAPGEAAESAEVKALRARFESALQTLKVAKLGARGGFWATLSSRLGKQYLYELPWYVMVGAPGTGKTTALRYSGLHFPLADKLGSDAIRGVGGTRNCDWFFTDRAVLIDTAGRYTTHEADPEADRGAWRGFLDLIKKARPRRPINGVLLAVSATDLLAFTGDQRAAHAAQLRSRIQELHSALGIQFPVYVLVTKCDLLAGFMDFFADMDKVERAQVWGSTFDYALSIEGKAAEGFAPAFDALTARLLAGSIERMQHERDAQRRARIYGFPQQFGGLRDALDELLKLSFSGSTFDAAPCLRGVYFASGTQEGAPIDRVLGSIARELKLERLVLPPNQNSGRSFFLTRLLDEVIFRESALAGSDLKWERRRIGLAWASYAVIGLVALAFIAAWTASTLGNRAYVAHIGQTAEDVRKLAAAVPPGAAPDLLTMLPALNAMRELAESTQAREAPWVLGFGLFQGRKLQSASRQSYERMLQEGLLPRLSLRLEQQMRTGGANLEAQYEALKVYVMLHEPDGRHFNADAFKDFVQFDWDNTLDGAITPDQRAQLDGHLEALVAAGIPGSAVAQDHALVQAVRAQLANLSLAQRVYTRLKSDRTANQFPEFTVAKAGGASAPLVYERVSGKPLTSGVAGRYTYDGYWKGFQKNVEKVSDKLAEEESWVVGLTDGGASRWKDRAAVSRLTDEARRLYLTDYAETWKAFIADIQVKPGRTPTENVQITRILSAPDNPMVPLVRAMVRETTLLAADQKSKVEQVLNAGAEAVKERQEQLSSIFGTGSGNAAPGKAASAVGRPESIVDDQFKPLRDFATAPGPNDKSQLDTSIILIGELYTAFNAAKVALEAKSKPPESPTPARIREEAPRFPEPARSLLNALAATLSKMTGDLFRANLGEQINAEVGEPCRKFITNRYPFNRMAAQDVTQDDFGNLFGAGGIFDGAFQKMLLPIVDTGSRPWTFRQNADLKLGGGSSTLAQFQNAQVIRDTFFRNGGKQPTLRLDFTPIDMDSNITQFTLDVDGQIVRYAHGPAISTPIQWPGPRGSNQVRIQLTPTTTNTSGALASGPWALFRLLDRMQMEPTGSPEIFRVAFNIDGRRAIFEVKASSVQNPFKLRELEQFRCPRGI